MIYSTKEYSEKFRFGGKLLSVTSIKRRCRNKQLPRNHEATKKGHDWIIEVKDLPDNILKNYNISLTLKPK